MKIRLTIDSRTFLAYNRGSDFSVSLGVYTGSCSQPQNFSMVCHGEEAYGKHEGVWYGKTRQSAQYWTHRNLPAWTNLGTQTWALDSLLWKSGMLLAGKGVFKVQIKGVIKAYFVCCYGVKWRAKHEPHMLQCIYTFPRWIHPPLQIPRICCPKFHLVQFFGEDFQLGLPDMHCWTQNFYLSV